MGDMPPLNALRAFEATARHLSATKAAGELHVTLGAVSHQLRALEDFLGLELFVRGHRQLYLTERGEQYYQAISSSFSTIRAATVALKRPSAKGTLKVRAYTTFALRWLIPRLSSFYADHQSVELVLSTSNDPVDFNRDQLDFAIRLGNGTWPGARSERLIANILVPVCSPRLAARGPAVKRPADLANHVLLQSDWPERRDDWREWLRGEGIKRADHYNFIYFESSALCYQAAIEGQGFAMAQTALIEDDLASGKLVSPFRSALDKGPYTYYLIYPESRRLTPQMESFRDWLVAEAAEPERAKTRPIRTAEVG
jgi:LysR family glycine cleavage system transcriptional activator